MARHKGGALVAVGVSGLVRPAASATASRPSALAAAEPWTVLIGLQLGNVLLLQVGDGLNGTGSLLMMSGVISSAAYGLVLLSMVRRGFLLTPLFFYLSASLVRLGICTIYAGTALNYGFGGGVAVDIFYLGRFNPIDDLVPGQTILLIGDLCFLLGGLLVGLHRTRLDRFPGARSAHGVWSAGLAATLIGLSLSGLVKLGVSIGGLGKLGPKLMDFLPPAGLAMMLVAEIVSGASGIMRVRQFVSWGLLLVSITLALDSYMKESIVVASLPLVVYFLVKMKLRSEQWNRHDVSGIVVGAALISIFVLVISGYSDLRRPEFWNAGGLVRERPAIWSFLGRAVVSAVPGTASFSEVHAFPERGVWRLMARQSHANEAAWAYRRVQQYGYRQGSFFGDLIPTVIPRILWPEKPNIWWGREFAVLIGAASSVETATSSFGLPMAASYYWHAGVPGLIGGMVLSGLLFGICWQLFRRRVFVNPIATVAGLILFVQGITWFEGEFFGGLEFYLYLLLVFGPGTSLLDLYRGWVPHPAVKGRGITM